tara:strand:- start:877 stop:1116 length:240 start_codon:yes stop_codon:yes gene_type:complete
MFLIKVVAAFKKDKNFEEALDRACRIYMNKNAVTTKFEDRSICAEFLARYADQILKKTGEKLEDSAREALLDDVVSIFE